LTWTSVTLLNIFKAVFAFISRPARAVIVVDFVYAGGVILAGRHFAFVYVDRAVGTLVPGVGAVAGVHVDSINAMAAMQARIILTIVYIYRTIGSRVAS
jgi:hypothetical protein